MVKSKKSKIVVKLAPRSQQMKAKKKKNKAASQEVTRLGAALRTLGGLGGAAVGGLIGQPAIGSATGTHLGAALSRWLGSGDYSVSQNSIVTRSSAGIPAMHSTGQSVIIRHKEFLGEVVSSQTFAVNNVYPLNPGVALTFPWLSGIAARFTEYTFKGVVFHYVPTSGSAVSSTNAALGSVILQTSYRATEDQPLSKVEMLNEYWSTEGAPNEAFCHPIECNPKENPFNVQYVRGDLIPAGDPLMMYDLGKTFLAVSGQQAAGVVLGDLWVTYEVELRKPVLTTNVVDRFPGQNGKFAAGSISALFNGTTTLVGGLNCTFNTNTITFPKGSVGSYVIQIFLTRIGVAITASSMTATLTNCTATASIPLFSTATTPVTISEIITGGVGTTMWSYAVVIPNPSLQATVGISPTITGPSSFDVYTTIYRVE